MTGQAQPASREDFYVVSEILRDLRTRHYAKESSLAPSLLVVLCRTQIEGASVVKLLPADAFQAEEAGAHGKELLAFTMQKLSTQPDTLVVGYSAEAWTTTKKDILPEEDPDRAEVVLLNLLSAECQALQVCLMTRTANGVTLKVGDMQFMTGEMQFKA